MRMIARAAVVAAILFSVSGWAADLDELKDTTPGERAKAQTAMMKMKLGLTDAEVAKVAELKTVLTADQFTKFEASKEEMMEKLADHIRADRKGK